MSSCPFIKLSRKHRSLNGYSQVWLAQDHILLVRSVRVRETYQRFLLSEIQAIVITNGPDPSLRRALAGVGVFLWLVWAATTVAIAGQVFLWSTGLIAVAMLAREVMRGPHCRCVIQTAVSRESIPALSRTREARRFLDVVAPRIADAQSNLVRSEVPSLPPELNFAPSPGEQPPPLRREAGYAMEVFFLLLLATAILTFAGSFTSRSSFLGIISFIYISELTLGGIAIGQSRSRDTLNAVVAIVSLVFVLMDCFFFMGPRVWTSFVDLAAQRVQPQDLAKPLNIPSQTLVFSLAWRIVFSAIGLFACRQERRA